MSITSVNNNAKYAVIVKEVVAQLRAEEREARAREALRARSRGGGPDEERFRESNVDIAYYSDELFERGLDMFDKLIDGSHYAPVVYEFWAVRAVEELFGGEAGREVERRKKWRKLMCTTRAQAKWVQNGNAFATG